MNGVNLMHNLLTNANERSTPKTFTYLDLKLDLSAEDIPSDGVVTHD